MGSAYPVPRAYIRHPADVPIEVSFVDLAQADLNRLKDVSLGGLACRTGHSVSVGAVVEVTIRVTDPPFAARGRVAWCEQQGDAYDVGVQFLVHDDAFAARMVEQICHIEHYREEVLRKEGRQLDSETAAMEWIAKYAQDFPSPPGRSAG